MFCKTSLLPVLVALAPLPIRAEAPNNEVAWDEEPRAFSNATNELPEITGYDYRKVYPGSPMKGWELTWSVAYRQENATSAWTGASFGFHGPEKLREYDTNESWATCGFTAIMDSPLKPGDKVDPLCRGIVSDKCQKALVKAVEKSSVCDKEGNDYVPEECIDDFAKADVDQNLIQGTYSYTSMPYYEVHAPGNFTLYDSLLRKVVVQVTGYLNNERDPKGKSAGNQHIQGFTACIGATEIKDGSRSLQKVSSGTDEDKKDDKKEDNKEETKEDKSKENEKANEDKSGDEDKPQGGAASTLSLGAVHIAAFAGAVMALNTM